jgi:RND family efflux transporter MFP subunit
MRPHRSFLGSALFVGTTLWVAGLAHAATLQTARLDSVWVQPERTAAAQVMPRNESRLAAEVGGRVERWSADVGANVQRGQVLVQIDPTDYQLALERAQAQQKAAQARAELARTQLKRAQDLVKQGFFSQEALTQRETEVALHEAELTSATTQQRTAQRQLDKTTLRAPFAGTVLQRQAQVGETVSVGSLLLVLAEQGPVEIQAAIAPADVAGLRRASRVEFLPQGSTVAHAVKLARITATLQTASRSQTARLTPAAGFESPAGSAGTIRWQDPTPHIPATLVVRRGAALGVFVQAGTVARFVPLPEAQEGRAVPTQLKGDTQIVVQGQAALTDGQTLATQAQ